MIIHNSPLLLEGIQLKALAAEPEEPSLKPPKAFSSEL